MNRHRVRFSGYGRKQGHEAINLCVDVVADDNDMFCRELDEILKAKLVAQSSEM